jgi:DHA3 family macrolide efflux protein-like MFS transporter
VAITDIGDLALWIGSAWYVTTTASPGVGVALLLVVTGMIRIGVSLVAGISQFIANNIRVVTNISALLYIVGVTALFAVVSDDKSYFWLIAVESIRAIAVSVLRVVRESWLKALTENEDNNSYSGKVIAITHTVRVVAPAISGLLIAVLSFEKVCLLMVGQSVIIGLLTYLLSERIHYGQAIDKPENSKKLSVMSLDPVIVDMTLIIFFVNAAIAPLGVYLPTVIKYSYDAGVTQFGIGEGLLGLGAVLGSLLGMRIVRLGKSWSRYLAVTQVVIYISMALSKAIVELYIYLIILGLTVGAMQAGALSIYLEKIPKDNYLRIRSIQMASAGMAYPLGVTITGMLVSIYSPQIVPIFQAMIMGVAIAVSLIYIRVKNSSVIITEE